MRRGIHILLIEDDIVDAELTQYALRQGGIEFTIKRVDTREAFLEEMQCREPDVVLSDSAVPGFNGGAALTMVQERFPHVPFIFVTGTMGEEAATETLKRGATDYVLKTRLLRLGPAVVRALREAQERAERRRAQEKLRESNERLRGLSVHLQSVREEDRRRIAREVHDELGQSLTGLKMDLARLVNRLHGDPKAAQQKVKAMSGQIDAMIHTIRRICTELRPGVLDDLGLVAAIEWQASEFQSRTGIPCHVASEVKDPVGNQSVNTAIFRIFQETLTNIIRHAQAGRVEVRLTQPPGELVLEVSDNGRGITPAEIDNAKSMGLLGMRERAELLGGDFNIRGTPGRGTTVRVALPIKRNAGEEQHTHESAIGRRPRGGAARIEADPRG